MDVTQKGEDGGNARDMVKSGKGKPRERNIRTRHPAVCAVFNTTIHHLTTESNGSVVAGSMDAVHLDTC